MNGPASETCHPKQTGPCGSGGTRRSLWSDRPCPVGPARLAGVTRDLGRRPGRTRARSTGRDIDYAALKPNSRPPILWRHCDAGCGPSSKLRPPPGDTAGTPAVPATSMPVPAIGLSATHRPGHYVGDPRHDLMIAAGAAIPFQRPGARHRPHHVLVAVGSGFGPAVDITQPGAQPLRLRPVTLAARFSSWHGFQLRRAGIRCSRSHAERCNRGSGSGSRDPRPTSAPAV